MLTITISIAAAVSALIAYLPALVYGEILQEIRVAQTGAADPVRVQVPVALAYTARFASVTMFQGATYAVVLLLCAAARPR